MRERVSGTMTHLGQTSFLLRDLLEAPGEMMVKYLAVTSGNKFVGQGSVVMKVSYIGIIWYQVPLPRFHFTYLCSPILLHDFGHSQPADYNM